MVHFRPVSVLVLGFFLTMALVSCSGGGQPTSQQPGLSVCTPADVGPDQNVTCEVPGGFEDGCACFFIQGEVRGAPVSCQLNADHRLALVSPSRAGTFTISFQCGDRDLIRVAEGFIVRPLLDLVTSECAADSDCHNGRTCENGRCVVRSSPPTPGCSTNFDCTNGQVCRSSVCGSCLSNAECSGGATCRSGVCSFATPSVVDSDSDGVADASDTCPNTPPRTSVDSHGCPATVAGACTPACTGDQVCQSGTCVSPTSVVPVVTLRGQAMHGTKLGMARIDWSIQGVRDFDAYLYGPSDCNNFAVDPVTGENFNIPTPPDRGSPNYQTYQSYVRARACTEADGQCNLNPELESPTPTGVFGIPLIIYIPGGRPQLCRIPITATTGTLYTRMKIAPSRYVLVVQPRIGAALTSAKEFTEAPITAIQNPVLHFNSSAASFEVSFNYTHATSTPWVIGCATTESPATAPDAAGNGSFRRTNCRFMDHGTVRIVVPGLHNQATEEFTIDCVLNVSDLHIDAGPVYDAAADGRQICPDSSSCARTGFVGLTGRASRRCTKTRMGQTPEVESVPWGLSMRISQNETGCTASTDDLAVVSPLPPDMSLNPVVRDSSGSEAQLRTRLAFNHDCSGYALTVVNGSETQTVSTTAGGAQTPIFEIITPSGDTNHRGLDWYYTFTANDAVDDGWGDDYCSPAQGQWCGSTGDGGDTRVCVGYSLSRGSFSGNNCIHASDDGISNCRDYVVNAVVPIRVQNISSIVVHCCEYGRGHTPGSSEPGRCLASGTSRVFHVPEGAPTRPFDRSRYQETYNWQEVLRGERITCDFEATSFGGETLYGPQQVFDRPASHCDGPDDNGGRDPDDSSHYD